MSGIFIKIFNLGVTAGWIVLAVLLLRPLLRKAPKWINCLLWGIVGLRLCFPFSFESVFSLIPSAEPLPSDITVTQTPAIDSGIGAINSAVNPMISDSLTPSVGASANPMQVIIEIAAYLWVIGIALMLSYGIASYIMLRLKVRPSVKCRDNVYYCDEIDSPFILGVIMPKIYLPSGISAEAESHVIAHENSHLKRKDHLWKPLAFALLAVYWFNPLIWVAYILLCRDIEMACDEKVIKEMDSDAKKGYSEALVSCSIHRKRIMACPLAFGEVGVKARIKSVLNYKKPAFWIIVIALVATLILSVCFLTNPMSDVRDLLEPGSEWRCEGDATIDVAIDNTVRMTGTLSFDAQDYEIVIEYHNDGRNVYAEILKSEILDLEYETDKEIIGSDEYKEWYAELSEEHLLLSGVLRSRREDLVLKIERDNLGIGQKELVFKKTRESGNRFVEMPLPPDGEYSAYIKVIDCGTEKARSEVSFVQAKLDGGDIIFVLKWKNNSFGTQIVGKSFEVYRYDGDKLIELEHIGGWQEVAVGVGPFSLSYPSYNITEHYDIPEPGKYRFYAYGAWVDFEVINVEFDDSPMVYDTEFFDIDGDGLREICKIGRGFTSGLFTFSFTATEPGAETADYMNYYLSEWMDFDFVRSDDGNLQIRGVTQEGKERLFDISISDGNVILSEGGEALAFYGSKVQQDSYSEEELSGLKKIYPDYFGLDASKGLDVIVWQMAKNSYSFGLLPHAEARDRLDRELWDLKTARADDMRAILSTYDISEDMIRIIPWQNPYSSYIGDYWNHWRAIDDITPHQNMYIAIVRDMIFGAGVRSSYPCVYESEFFDMDGDGETEYHCVALGVIDGSFLFSYIVSEDGRTADHYDTFYTEPMSLKFIKEDGKLRLRGRTENGRVVIYDISIKDGHVVLAENDTSGNAAVTQNGLDLSKADLTPADQIIITDGMTGEKKYLHDILDRENYKAVIDTVKKIKGTDPVSNRGYSGFRYYVEIIYDYQEIFSFSIYSDETGAYIVCGYYETVGGFDYPCRYKLTDPSYSVLTDLFGKYFK